MPGCFEKRDVRIGHEISGTNLGQNIYKCEKVPPDLNDGINNFIIRSKKRWTIGNHKL
jgi:hypothetical protein